MSIQQYRDLKRAMRELGNGNSIGQQADPFSVLTQEQRERLTQISYFAEIAYLGLNGALADGRFGVDVGIYDNQRDFLREKIGALIAEATQQIQNARIELLEHAIEVLDEDQSAKATSLLGQYFEYEDLAVFAKVSNFHDSLEEASSQNKAATAVANPLPAEIRVPDYSKKENLFRMLDQKSVRDELQLSPDQVRAFRDLSSEYRNAKISGQAAQAVKDAIRTVVSRKESGLDTTESERILKNADTEHRNWLEQNQENLRGKYLRGLEEVVTPSQIRRLEQIANHAEIAHLGVRGALIKGQLSKSIGVRDDQKGALYQEIQELERQAEVTIRRIKVILQHRAFLELNAEQRERATTLLGPYFEFVDGGVIAWKGFNANQKEIFELRYQAP